MHTRIPPHSGIGSPANMPARRSPEISIASRPGPFRTLRLLLLLCALVSASALATPPSRSAGDPGTREGRLVTRAPLPGESERVPTDFAPARTDTIDFGFYEIREDGLTYAVQGGLWTWDHGAADPLEGWTSDDLTTNDRTFWRHVTATIWSAEGNPLPWPQMNASAGIALCGATEGYADTLSWENGVGYGNHWCQRLISPELTYDGSGTVDLSFQYFNETELGYDYSQLLVRVGAGRTLLNAPGFTGRIGIDTAGVITPETYTRPITNAELGGGVAPRTFQVVLEVHSDGAKSDEDAWEEFNSDYGAIGVDNVAVEGSNLDPPVTQSYAFESGLDGWTTEICPGIGSFLGVAALSQYVILDPCGCASIRMSGNIMELHDDTYQHPEGQYEYAISPIVDRAGDIGDPAYLEYNRVMADWSQYSELPFENAVFFRAGWSYYPYESPEVPGLITWSPRAGSSTFLYTGSYPVCHTMRDIATDWGIPPTSEKVKFIYELLQDCGMLSGLPCSHVSNPTPLIDNFRIRNVHVANAPHLVFEPGGRFQDVFGQDNLLGVYNRANANTAYNVRLGSSNPARLGDSLVVTGPPVNPNGENRWEARLWFRLSRLGPVQGQLYDFLRWERALMAKGIDFFTGPTPDFTWGYMDSVESGVNAAKNKFCSQFRDGPSSGGHDLPADLCFNWGGGGEQAEGNEVLPDNILTPGTKVEYFVTANYTCLPGEYFYLPDTTGRYFQEFEILPGYRTDGEFPKFPCVLYVKAYPYDAEQIIPHALNAVLSGAGPHDPIPDPAPWDQYDYLDSNSSWRATLYRETGGNSGATLPQLLGYRALILSTGTYGIGCTVARDWMGFTNWMESSNCDGNYLVQGFLADGNSVSEIIDELYPSFLPGKLGGQHVCTKYADDGCPPGETDNDDNFCVRLEPVPGAPFSASVPLDLFGNWCPVHFDFDVVTTAGTGVGNQNYVKIGTGTATPYAQVVNNQIAGAYRYRSVLNGYSSLALTTRDLEVAPDPSLECPYDYLSRVGAVSASLQGSLRWMLNIGDPQAFGLCTPGTDCGMFTVDVPEGIEGSTPVNRLYPNQPNPFNPRTSIRFSLAAAENAKLLVYDVTGRAVRTLVDGPQTAGVHEVIWDGTRDDGRRSPSGVYWCRLSTAGFVSNRRMVVLK